MKNKPTPKAPFKSLVPIIVQRADVQKKKKQKQFEYKVEVLLPNKQFHDLLARAENCGDSRSRCARRLLERGAKRLLPPPIEKRSLQKITKAIETLRATLINSNLPAGMRRNHFRVLGKLMAAQKIILGLI
jgi:hypothetical protein